jgi:hypothetical protein
MHKLHRRDKKPLYGIYTPIENMEIWSPKGTISIETIPIGVHNTYRGSYALLIIILY